MMCNSCGLPFDVDIKPGAILIGHPEHIPDKMSLMVMKAHICQDCEIEIVEKFKIKP